MFRRFYAHFVEFVYWRMAPFFSHLHFKLEKKNLLSYLHGGEIGRNPGEITKSELRNILGDVETILEVGANDGRDTLELALIFPQAIIHAIECDVRLIGLFNQRMRNFPKVHLHAFAAWKTEGFMKFHSSSGASMGSSSLLEPKLIREIEPDIIFESRMPVVAARVSKLIEAIDLEVIDLVWMDVQGAEFMILKDLQPHLSKIRSFYLEVEVQEMYEGEALYSEVLEFFIKNNFIPKCEMSNGMHIVNVLFTNRQLVQ
jgi:FkbM family methyltransferase